MKQSDDIGAFNRPIFQLQEVYRQLCVVGGVGDGEKTVVLDWRSITAVRNSVKLW